MIKNNNKILMIFGILISFLIYFSRISDAQQICPLDSLTPKKVTSLETFGRIPILNEGRIKPIETYAENFLLRLSGKKHYEKESGLEWFARFLFAPRTTFDDKIFLINNPDILEAIKVEPEKHRRYSYRQLEQGYDKIKELADVIRTIDNTNLSVVDREILRIYSNLYTYLRLSGAFAYGFPHPDFDLSSLEIKEQLGLNPENFQFSFYDIFEQSNQLMNAASLLSTKEHAEWNEKEQIISRIINAMFFWSENYADCPLGIIPTFSQQDNNWLSPMDIIRLNNDESAYIEEIKQIRNMTIHYWNNEQLNFDLSARAFMNSVKNRLSPNEKIAVNKIPVELFYNHLRLFFWSKVFYALGFFFVLFSLLYRKRIMYWFTLIFTICGFLPHLTALILRIMIMSRPPVSNLYETFIFVGLIGAALGLIIEKVNKNQLGLAISTICGLVFIFISDKFSSEGDTMQMLVAVLNSNFWLSTHVLSITIGYAAVCVSGLIGHIYICQLLMKSPKEADLNTTFNNMLGILGFGLIMTFLGTALGGIWADQSWGRFWGWDPKENGALLIVLWTAIIFHARLAKLINKLGVAVGCVLGLIVVMWAWFGVNLLSIGLHSYGFTSGIANSLVLYVLFEFLFLSVTVILLGNKNIKI